MRAALLVLALGWTLGCVDGPSGVEPVAWVDPLAETFEAMSRAAGEYGDLARSDGFAHAALAVRAGVTPSRLEVLTGTTSEAYDAFVSAVVFDTAVGGAFRPPARRTLVGWRRTAEGTMRVISLSTPSDSAPILSPLSLGPGVSTAAVFAGASAMMNEGVDTPQGKPDLSAAWYATGGWVKLREVAVVGSCSRASTTSAGPGVVRCDETRYLVRFELTMQRIAGRPPQVAGGASRRSVSVGEPVVSGLRLRLSCAGGAAPVGCR